jgi:hypothetical protein
VEDENRAVSLLSTSVRALSTIFKGLQPMEPYRVTTKVFTPRIRARRIRDRGTIGQ